MAETSKKLFQLSPRDWREHDQVIARSALGEAVIASKGEPPTDLEAPWRRLIVEVDGDPAEQGVRDAVFYGLGIGRPSD